MTVMAAATLFAAGSLAPTAAQEASAAPPPQDCSWVSFADEHNSNVLFPDTSVNYYLTRVNLPPGAELVLRGRFPHARYMAFNAYDEVGRPSDALTDHTIAPDDGSTNPFVAGNSRDDPMRSYTARVVASPPPEQPEPNTLYLGADGRPSHSGSVIYRVYLPDRGRDQFGGTGLPEVSLRTSDGTEVRQHAACSVLTDQPSTGLNDTDRQSGGPGSPEWTTASDPLDWERFFNMPRSYARRHSAELTEHTSSEQQGGYYSDHNNAYVYAYTARRHGDVLVMRGRLPDVVETYDGQRRFGRGDLRYWSMCHGTSTPQGATETIDCLFDEELVTSRREEFTIVVSTPEDRPANARRACGVNWMAWGARPDGTMIMRNQLATPSFDHSVQQVTEPGTEEDVLSAYLPHGEYTTTASFEARGCSTSPQRHR